MKICLLCYRGNKYCGGQGIYLYYLARELHRLGHEVDIIIGPPYCDIPEGVRAHKLDSLNLYDRRHDGRSILEFNHPYDMLTPFNVFEFGGTKLGMFPEIFTFSLKAYLKIRELALNGHRYDVIHDNQCLAYGLLWMKTLGIPVVATIHHPLPIDTRAELAQTTSAWQRFRQLILYPPFMQGVVSRRLDAILTDSESSAEEIRREFRIADDKLHIAYCGVDTQVFRNVDGHRPATRDECGRLIVVGRTSDRKKGILFLFKALQIVLTVTLGLSHGSNDGQKSIGIIAMGLLATGSSAAFEVPLAAIFVAAASLALGAVVGGQKVMRTVGWEIFRIRPVHGFAA